MKETGFNWEYAPAPEAKDHAKLKSQYDLFINGKFVKPNSKKYFDTINPATEQVISSVADANEKDVDNAVKAARNAYDKTWSKMPAKERGKYIYRIARMIQERARVADLFVCAVEEGMNTLKMDGMEKVLMGLTDLKQVRTVCIK